MMFDSEIIKVAFDRHFQIYADGRRNWGVPSHIRLWNKAAYAFETVSHERFEQDVYQELRRRWQVFRGSKQVASSHEIFDLLFQRCGSVRQTVLSDIGDENLEAIWGVFQAMRGVKKTKAGPSVMAISKFLHFWNPRLFVIVDDEVMWRWVLRHSWIREQLQSTHEMLSKGFHKEVIDWASGKCDLHAYLSILVWAGQVVRTNPDITKCFLGYLGKHQGTVPLPPDIASYQAAAMEWFLMGVVEINPGEIPEV